MKAKNQLQEKKNKGRLFIISGPSGSGKTSLCKKLPQSLHNLKCSVSYTTRNPRPQEGNDIDYTFISRKEFRSRIQQGEFAEWATVHGELYGTSKIRLEEMIHSGIDVLLDIDTQGAKQLKEKYRRGIYIFVLPLSMEILKKRLKKRKSDSQSDIEKRLKRAIDEIRSYREYDYVIVNNKLDVALRELEAIIIAHRVSTKMIDPQWIEEQFLR